MTSEPGDSSSIAVAQSLEALRSYRQRFGTAEVPRRVRAFGVDLGKWVAQCRDNYRDGQLSPEQVQALESVEGWQWGARKCLLTCGDGLVRRQGFEPRTR